MTDTLQDIQKQAYQSIVQVSGAATLDDISETRIENVMMPWFDQIIASEIRGYVERFNFQIEHVQKQDHYLRLDRMYPENPEQFEDIDGLSAVEPYFVEPPEIRYEGKTFIAEVAAEYVEKQTERIDNVLQGGEI